MKKILITTLYAVALSASGVSSALAESVAVEGGAIFILDNSVPGSQIVVKNLANGPVAPEQRREKVRGGCQLPPPARPDRLCRQRVSPYNLLEADSLGGFGLRHPVPPGAIHIPIQWPEGKNCEEGVSRVLIWSLKVGGNECFCAIETISGRDGCRIGEQEIVTSQNVCRQRRPVNQVG